MSDASTPSSDTSPSLLKRILLWGGGVVGGLAVLLLAAALVLPRLFTSEQLKGYVVPPLENATGRTVDIEDIGLRVLPFPAVRVTGFRLANDDRFGTEPAVSAQALNVDVALWPLFAATIRPKAIALVDPVVRYEVAEDGTTNFDTLGGPADTTETDDSSPLAAIPVSHFRATGAQIHYTDRSTGQFLKVDFGAQLRAGPDGNVIASEGRVDAQAIRAVLPSVGPDTLALQDAGLDYEVRATPNEGHIDLGSVAINTAPLSFTVSGTVSELHTEPTVDLTVETEETDLSEIASFAPAASIEGIDPQGRIRLTTSIVGPLPDSTGNLDRLSVDGTGELLGVGANYEGAALVREVDADLVLSLDSVAVRSIDGMLLDAPVSGQVAVHNPVANQPELALRLETGALDLATLAAVGSEDIVERYNPQGTLRLDATTTGSLPEDADNLDQLEFGGMGELAGVGIDYGGEALLRELGTSLSFSNASVTLEEIDGTLLDRAIQGNVTIRDPMGTPRIDGRLDGSADLARLASLAEAESDVEGDADYDIQFAGPVDQPDAIRPTGHVRLSELLVPSESLREPLSISDVAVELTGPGLSVDEFAMRSGDQTMRLRASVQNLFPLSDGLDEADPSMLAEITLTADQLDLVELVPEVDASEVTYSQLFAAHLAGTNVQGKNPEAVAKERYGDVDVPAYNVNGRVEVGTLLNEPQRYDDLSFDVQMQDRRLEIRNVTAQTYGGDLAGSLTLDQSDTSSAQRRDDPNRMLLASTVRGGAPQSDASSTLSYDFQLEDARAADILDDWTTLGRLVTGTLDLSIDGDSPLSGLLPRSNALTASGRSLVVDGGLSMDTGLATSLTNVVGFQLPSLSNLKQLGGPFRIQDGAFQVDTWTVRGQGIQGTLGGALGLNGSLALTMEADLPLSTLRGGSMMDGDGGLGGLLGKLTEEGEEGERTVPVRLRIGGTMSDPQVNLLNRDAVRSSVREIAKDAGMLNRLQNLFNSGGGR